MSWGSKKLADICEIKLGKTPSRSEKSYWDDEKKGSNVWVSIADLTKLNSRFISDSKEYITNKGAALIQPVKAGTLLMSFKLSIGKLAYANCDLFTNEAIVALPIKDKNLIDSDFLYYFLQYYDWDKETENDVKLKGKTLNKAKLSEIKIPLPPLATQQKIVAKLDAIIAEIDKAKAAAEANAKNAAAIFDSILISLINIESDGCFANKKPLSDLCELIVDCEHKTAPTQDSGYPLIRTPNIGKGRLLLESVYRVSEQIYSEWTRRAVPQPGDLILAREAPAGNVAVIPENVNVCLGQRTVLIRSKSSVFVPEFLAMFLLHPEIQAKLLAHSRGATVQHVNMKDIRALVLGAIPPLSTQKEILSKINKAVFHSEVLKKKYIEKINLLDALKNSILRKAFSGELVKE